ncbi:nucleotide pyrophosphohydrolase [Sphingobacterium hungaricum]
MDIDKLIREIISFRNERDWSQFHNTKDLAIALNIETSELLELFLWKSNEDFNKEKFEDEIADILMYLLLIVEKHDLNIEDIVRRKMEKNRLKYPVDKSKGISKKYNEL